MYERRPHWFWWRLGCFIGEGDLIPAGYGIAYRVWDRMGCICYPMPFNWLARWVRAASLHLRFPESFTAFEEREAAAFQRGQRVAQARLDATNEEVARVSQECGRLRREVYMLRRSGAGAGLERESA